MHLHLSSRLARPAPVAAAALALVFARSLPHGVVYACVAFVGGGYAGAQMFPMAMLPDVASRSADAREGVQSFLEKRPPAYPDAVSRDMPDFYPWWDQPAYE